MNGRVIVVGGGLAGSEAAWQIATRGIPVVLYEMRPGVQTGAHETEHLGELVCSNSLGSQLPDRSSGVLMGELEALGSLLLEVAKANAVPAGSALAVDREGFSAEVTRRLEGHRLIEIRREEMRHLPDGLTVIASGPLTSDALAAALAARTGEEHLYFYDALSPIVTVDSINFDVAFHGSRYGRGEQERGDYINCPLNKGEYAAFVEALRGAERIPLREFEAEIEEGVRAGLDKYFEGCLPIEVIAQRGEKALAFGPMRPVGLEDPRTGRRPYAVVQLRQDNLAGDLYNMVGFQTNLRYPEQRRVLRMIPGLEGAQFARYGQMHRNTFLNAPRLLRPTLQAKDADDLLFAGQITGVEGYLGNIATGLLAGLNAARLAHERPALELPGETMLGALCHYIAHAEADNFQPMKANFGILPRLRGAGIKGKRGRARAYAERASAALESFQNQHPELLRIVT